MAQAYPLSWPQGWKRTEGYARKGGRFSTKEMVYSGSSRYQRSSDLTVAKAADRVIEALDKMAIQAGSIVISTNIEPTLSGRPRSDNRKVDDPGAAVYWTPKGKPSKVIAIDLYTTVADNLAAIAATLEAMRAIQRHGSAEILDRTFSGFAALPEKTSMPWRDVLGIHSQTVTKDDVEKQFRVLAKDNHPDRGGDRDRFEAIVQARSDALKEL